MGDRITDAIAEKALPILQEMGYDLADIDLVKEGTNWFLRFFIEYLTPDYPVTINDCQMASERLSEWLDEYDPIPQAYYLEVSSPGIERPLKKEKDFLRFRGHKVQVNTYAPVNGTKEHVGILGQVTNGELTITKGDANITIDREKISGIHLYWDDSQEG